MRGREFKQLLELQGEKIDIVNWSEDISVVVSNALSPAEVLKVNINEEAKSWMLFWQRKTWVRQLVEEDKTSDLQQN